MKAILEMVNRYFDKELCYRHLSRTEGGRRICFNEELEQYIKDHPLKHDTESVEYMETDENLSYVSLAWIEDGKLHHEVYDFDNDR